MSDTPVPGDAEHPAPVIEKGHAQEAVSAALDDVCAAVLRLEAVSMALARALDSAKP